MTVVPFCEKVFSFDLFARVLRIPSFASRLLWRDFERQIGWTAHKHSSEREKKKAILAAVSNFESDDRAIVPAKSARVQIRDDFLIHAFASRMICARFSSLHIRVVVPGGAREVNREKSKNLISQRVEATAVRSFCLKSPKNTTILTLTLKRFSQPSLPFLLDNFTENLIN